MCQLYSLDTIILTSARSSFKCSHGSQRVWGQLSKYALGRTRNIDGSWSFKTIPKKITISVCTSTHPFHSSRNLSSYRRRYRPITTYGGRGVAKTGVDPAVHAVIHTSVQPPPLLENEPPMPWLPIRVVAKSPDESLLLPVESVLERSVRSNGIRRSRR